jgi:hypothetical protein
VGKRVKAEPVAALYEQGRISHCGLFSELEDQLTSRMARKLDLHEDAVVRHCGSAVAIMGFEYAERDRPVPVYADRCFRVDEPPPTPGH